MKRTFTFLSVLLIVALASCLLFCVYNTGKLNGMKLASAIDRIQNAPAELDDVIVPNSPRRSVADIDNPMCWGRGTIDYVIYLKWGYRRVVFVADDYGDLGSIMLQSDIDGKWETFHFVDIGEPFFNESDGTMWRGRYEELRKKAGIKAPTTAPANQPGHEWYHRYGPASVQIMYRY